jgi:DNA-binding transcriptional ArsR family regulator
LASPHRRALLDILRAGPATTGAMAAGLPELSRFAVMQHLGVLVDAGVVLVERRGRDRINHLNPVPLREWYERWVVPMADADAVALLALKRHTEALDEGAVMSTTEPLRTVRLTSQLHIAASAERTFDVMTQRILEWYPYSYGDTRTQRVVLEPRLGGAHYEDWGDGTGHLYGQVTTWDPPRTWSTRGRISPGSVLDTLYEISPDGEGVVVRVSKVAVGPFTDDEVAGIAAYGDISPYASAIEKLARA